MRRNWVLGILILSVLFFANTVSAQAQNAPAPTKHQITGTITLEPGVATAAPAGASTAEKYELVKGCDNKGKNCKWVYRKAGPNTNNFALSAEAAKELTKDLAAGQAARRQVETIQKKVDEKVAAVQESVDAAITEAQNEQASVARRLESQFVDSEKKLKADIAAVKKTAEDAASRASYGMWGLGVSIVALLLAGFAVFRSYRAGDGQERATASLTGREQYRPAAAGDAGAATGGGPAPADAG